MLYPSPLTAPSQPESIGVFVRLAARRGLDKDPVACIYIVLPARFCLSREALRFEVLNSQVFVFISLLELVDRYTGSPSA